MSDKGLFKKVLFYFLSWRIALFAIAFLSTFVLVKYGGTFPYVDRVLAITHLPNWIWGFGGFDGVHYLRIAQDGYKSVYYPTFFPVFPLLIRFIAIFIPKNITLDTTFFVDPAYFYSGLILANAFFLVALYYLYKLFRLDYSSKISWLSVLFLLTFPTSFYFGSIYTESLFLLLSVLVLYESRKRNFLLAGVFCMIASATRIVGVLLSIVVFFEFIKAIKDKEIKLWNSKFITALSGLIISPLGLAIYMIYLWKNFNNPVYFIWAQPYFGAQRSGTLILLPQVIYRYLKIFISIPFKSLQFFNSSLEFIATLAPLTFLLLFFKKIRFSYWAFVLMAILVPTFSGSFSSMPRYILAGFPLLPVLAEVTGKYTKPVMTFFAILAIILLSLFIGGYWVA